MSNYQAPLRDMRFVIHELVESGPICALPGYADCDAGLMRDCSPKILRRMWSRSMVSMAS